MIVMQGKGVSTGVANGPIYFFQRPAAAVTDAPAALFETHAMFAEDEDYMERMMNVLEETRCTAEKAVQSAGEAFSAVLSNDGQGIGLFRSEFLYLAAGGYPTEEGQFEAYKEVAAAMGGRRVVIRTLDIGADKQADHFQLRKEENPALGVRAIRLCLNRPEVFRTQLRALKMAADAAHKSGIRIGVCGELGADLTLLETLLAIGIDELSVPPASVLPLRAKIRETIAKSCTLEKLEC